MDLHADALDRLERYRPDDATLAAAARREAQEETGVTDLVVDPVPLDLDRHPAPCQPDPAGSHLDVRF